MLHEDEEELVGESPVMNELRHVVKDLGKSDDPVVLFGATGTGKEVVARAIHRASARRSRPFVAINCAALPEALCDTELFGCVAGAFTGAVARPGSFGAAGSGTLLLDEIALMSRALQPKLLRVCDGRGYARVGSDELLRFPGRLLAATNRDLRGEVLAGRFMSDLYYRLAAHTVAIPPLCDRKEDIAPIARELARRAGCPEVLSPEVLAALCEHTWPGNVRELGCVVLRLRLRRGVLDRDSVREAINPGSPGVVRAAVTEEDAPAPSNASAIDRATLRLAVGALRSSDGNTAAAAAKLGMDPKQLERLCARLEARFGVELPRSRGRYRRSG